jgi:hypothetical protein
MAMHSDRIDSVVKYAAEGMEITETWMVWIDEQDGCQLGAVQALFAPGLPLRGMSYAPGDGCDFVLSEMVAADVNVGGLKVDQGPPGCYREVTVTYKPLNFSYAIPPIQGVDPLTWQMDLQVGSASHQVAKRHMYFLGTYQHPTGLDNPPQLDPIQNHAINRQKGQLAKVASTAGELFTPILEVEVPDRVYTFTTYMASYDPHDRFDIYSGRVVNLTETRLSLPTHGFDKTFPPLTLWIREIRPEHQFLEYASSNGGKNSLSIWRVQYELVHRPTGWWLDLMNVGTQMDVRGLQNVNGGKLDDGKGGFWTWNKFKPGQSPIVTICDGLGVPLHAPVNLDLIGHPIQEKDGIHWLRYCPFQMISFYDNFLGLPTAAP